MNIYEAKARALLYATGLAAAALAAALAAAIAVLAAWRWRA